MVPSEQDGKKPGGLTVEQILAQPNVKVPERLQKIKQKVDDMVEDTTEAINYINKLDLQKQQQSEQVAAQLSARERSYSPERQNERSVQVPLKHKQILEDKRLWALDYLEH